MAGGGSEGTEPRRCHQRGKDLAGPPPLSPPGSFHMTLP